MRAVFGHGQVRLLLLAMLADAPRHGYDLIMEFREQFQGLYSPSAGTIYPRLAKLEQEGLVIKRVDGRKTLYTLTDAGRREVDDHLDDITAFVARTSRRLDDAVAAVTGSWEDAGAPEPAGGAPTDAERLRLDVEEQVRRVRRDLRHGAQAQEDAPGVQGGAVPAPSTPKAPGRGPWDGVGEAGAPVEMPAARKAAVRADAEAALRHVLQLIDQAPADVFAADLRPAAARIFADAAAAVHHLLHPDTDGVRR